MKSTVFFLIGVSLFLTVNSRHAISSENRSTPKNKQLGNDTIINALEHKIPVWMEEYKVPCVGVGIIENGKLKYVKVFGNLQKNVPAPVNAIFNIASMTKPVVAMVVLKLVEMGQWNLDEPLYEYWVDPDVLNDSMYKKLTTRHILSHQSGFPNWRTDKLKFEFEPGTKFQYSGEGFEYLRRALENKFNKSLGELSGSVLFKPLGMNDTRYLWDEDIKKTRFAFGHDSQGKKYETSDYGSINAAGGLLTTIEDYSKFLIYVMNGAGLSANLYNDMIQPQITAKEHIARGLGWELVLDLPNGEYALEHGGGNPGIKTMGILLPKSKRGIVIFTNGDNGTFICDNIIKKSIDIGQTIIDFTNSAYHAPIIKLSNEILDRYVGTYSRSDVNRFNFIVARAGNELTITGDAVPLFTLLPESENKFFVKGLGYQYEFIKDEISKIMKLNIYENGKLLLDANKLK